VWSSEVVMQQRVGPGKYTPSSCPTTVGRRHYPRRAWFVSARRTSSQRPGSRRTSSHTQRARSSRGCSRSSSVVCASSTHSTRSRSVGNKPDWCQRQPPGGSPDAAVAEAARASHCSCPPGERHQVRKAHTDHTSQTTPPVQSHAAPADRHKAASRPTASKPNALSNAST